jgi:two-component system cell cycle sensor histidine kinase/response regulator CckA
MASTALTQSFRHKPNMPEVQPPPAPAVEKRGGDLLELTGLAHDARNLVTALRLGAELLGEPGVLDPEHAHFAAEIGAMADASAGMMRKLTTLARAERVAEMAPAEPVTDLADELRQLGGLLGALAGPKIVVQTTCLPCAGTLRLAEESLTRILLNLVRNAADAMPEGGRIRITAQRGNGASFFWTLPEDMRPGAEAAGGRESVVLSVEDNGPGIRPELVERVFEPGFSTRRGLTAWPETQHQGLGLSIARQLVEEAGGTIKASSAGRRGARFEIELPLTNVTPTLLSEWGDSAGRDAS